MKESFVNKILKEALMDLPKRPSVKQFEQNSKTLGSGEEGVIKDFGEFVVKRSHYPGKQNETVATIQKLIKTKDPDYVTFYDVWYDETNHLMISLQKIPSKSFNQPDNDMSEFGYDFEEIVDDFRSIAKQTDIFPNKYNKFKNNKLAIFLWHLAKKHKNDNYFPSDLTPNNLCVINGEYKMFDCW